MKADYLVRACRENPELYKALLEWMDEHQGRLIKRVYIQNELPEIYRAQGAAREMSHMKAELEKQVFPRKA